MDFSRARRAANIEAERENDRARSQCTGAQEEGEEASGSEASGTTTAARLLTGSWSTNHREQELHVRAQGPG